MIECQDLVLGYAAALSPSINLEIKDNQWIGVIGQNGVGKSTFLKTILGMVAPYSGELKILGQVPGRFNGKISYIPQEREINLTQRMSGQSLILNSYNAWKFGLPWFKRKLHGRVHALIELVGASTYAHEPFNTLSGGQKKRIYLAQALVNQPQLLLLDEPLADLDFQAKQHFIASLQQIHQHQQLGLIIISHDMHEIASYLDGFIHFRRDVVHYCATWECVREDSYVGL
jgi:zinc/manganese transport system ATP-binding protein